MRQWLTRRWPLLVIVAAALLSRLPLLFAAVGGFHALNEGFYATMARLESTRPLVDVVFRPIDTYNMPLFTWVLIVLRAVIGDSEAAIRLPSLVAALASIYLVGVLADDLFGRKASWIAAAALALMPIHMLVGTNAQLDMPMVALALGGVVAYVRAYRGRSNAADDEAPDGGADGADKEAARAKSDPMRERRLRALAGVLFGLAIMTKHSAALFPMAIVAWETTRRRGLGWLARPSARLCAALTVAIPGVWLAAELAARGPARFVAQSSLAVTQAPAPGTVTWMATELFFQLGPPIAVAVVAGVVLALVRRTHGAALALWLLALPLALFAVFHRHTYYVFPYTPAAALLAAYALESLDVTWVRRTAVACALILAVPFALLAYDYKLPGAGTRDATVWMRMRAPEARQVVLPRPVWENSRYTYEYYLPGTRLLDRWPSAASVTSTPTFVVYSNRIANAQLPGEAASSARVNLPEGAWTPTEQVYTWPVLFGHALSFAEQSVHWLTPKGFYFDQVGPAWQFGTYRETAQNIRVVDLRSLDRAQMRDLRRAWGTVEQR